MRTAHLDVRATASLHASVRVGFVVPKYKHSSVDRNRLKRRLRELVRLEWLPMLPPVDVVMRVTPPAYVRDFDALRTELRLAGYRLAKLTFPEPTLGAAPTVQPASFPEKNRTAGDTPATPAT